jgi:hypothetical protein
MESKAEDHEVHGGLYGYAMLRWVDVRFLRTAQSPSGIGSVERRNRANVRVVATSSVPDGL